jgi:DNA-binding NarL/FixJ family response regulator
MAARRRVLIVEDEAFVSEALADLVEDIPELEVSGVAATLREARQLLEQLRPDIVIADLFLDDGNSLDLLRSLREQRLGTRVIVVTGARDAFAARDAVAAGALGYVLKAQPAKEIREAVRSVMLGRRYLSPRVEIPIAPHRRRNEEAVGLDRLSRRELEVLRLVVTGLTSAEIAQRLSVSPKTVDSHRSNMHRKLALRNAVDLIRFANANGIVATLRSPGETTEGGRIGPAAGRAPGGAIT